MDKSDTIAIPDTPDAVEPREFRMTRVFVRASWMGLVATVLFVAGAVWNRSQIVDDYDFWHSPDEWQLIALIVLVTVVPVFMNLFMQYRWRLRLDAQGLHRRRLFRWQTWPWEFFRDGRIARGSTWDAFVNPDEPWWRRTIGVSMVGEEDREYVLRVCLQFWTPPPVDLPETLTLKMPSMGFNRTVITMSSTGIDVSGPGVLRSYAWGDVQRLHITRVEEKHPGFYSLKLALPDRDIDLQVTNQNGTDVRTWSGPNPEVVSAFLKARIPPARTEETILWGKPVAPKDLDSRLEELRKQYRQFLAFAAVIAVVAVAVAVLSAVEATKFFRSHPNGSFLDYALSTEALGLWAMILVYALPVFTFQWFNFRKVRRELEVERARLAAGGGATAPD
ncbi:MAG: hypothetical protein RBU21_07855 [FCB group bacterium]|nr:hypothetical protein [FCB group bacterium]